MLTSSYVAIFERPLAAILDFREKKTCSALGKLCDFLQVIKDDHLNNHLKFSALYYFFPSLALKMPKIPGLMCTERPQNDLQATSPFMGGGGGGGYYYTPKY